MSEQITVDVTHIDKLHVGANAEMPHATEFKHEAWISSDVYSGFVSDGEIWTSHMSLGNLVRKLDQ